MALSSGGAYGCFDAGISACNGDTGKLVALDEFLRLFSSALIPDFQQYYHLRLTEIIGQWSPKEVLLLIVELPADSRFFGRLVGEDYPGWTRTEWLFFDMRNALESLRVMTANQGKKRTDFREWEHYPGVTAEKKKRVEKQMRSWRKRLETSGGAMELE